MGGGALAGWQKSLNTPLAKAPSPFDFKLIREVEDWQTKITEEQRALCREYCTIDVQVLE